MIVVTTPTGQIGRQLIPHLLDAGEAVRVIARDPARIPQLERDRVEVVVGSHDDPAVLDRALGGTDAVFWLVPPDPSAESAQAHYGHFTRAVVEAIHRHGIGHVVGVSSAGRGWPHPAGLLDAAFAMDAALERSGTAYRSLAMPFYMENLERQLPIVRDQGILSLTYAPDRPLPLIATRDIAEVAAGLLTSRRWTGQQSVPVFGPDRLTPVQITEVVAEVMSRPVTYQRSSLEDLAAGMTGRGASAQAVRDTTEMLAAQDTDIYAADWAAACPTPTNLRTWLEDLT